MTNKEKIKNIKDKLETIKGQRERNKKTALEAVDINILLGDLEDRLKKELAILQRRGA